MQSALLPRLRFKQHAGDAPLEQLKHSDHIVVGQGLRGALCPCVWSFLQLCVFCLGLLGDLLRGPDAPHLVKCACAQALRLIHECRASSFAVVSAFENDKRAGLTMCEVSDESFVCCVFCTWMVLNPAAVSHEMRPMHHYFSTGNAHLPARSRATASRVLHFTRNLFEVRGAGFQSEPMQLAFIAVLSASHL